MEREETAVLAGPIAAGAAGWGGVVEVEDGGLEGRGSLTVVVQPRGPACAKCPTWGVVLRRGEVVVLVARVEEPVGRGVSLIGVGVSASRGAAGVA